MKPIYCRKTILVPCGHFVTPADRLMLVIVSSMVVVKGQYYSVPKGYLWDWMQYEEM